MKILKIADKTLNKLLAIFIIIDIILIICNIVIKKSPPSEYILEVEEYVNELKNNGYTNVHYEKYVYNNIFSARVYATNGALVDNLEKVYNIDIDTKKELTLTELLSIFGIDNDYFQKQYKQGYLSFFDEDNSAYIVAINNSNLSQEEKDNYTNEINDSRNSIEYVNYNTDTYERFFINNDTIYIYVDNNHWRLVRKNEILNTNDTFTYKEIAIK